MDDLVASQLASAKRLAIIATAAACVAIGWLAYITLVPLSSVASRRIVTQEIILVDAAGAQWGEISTSGSTQGIKLMAGEDQLVGLGFKATTGEPELSLYGRHGEATIETRDSVTRLAVSDRGVRSIWLTIPRGASPSVRVFDRTGIPAMLQPQP